MSSPAPAVGLTVVAHATAREALEFALGHPLPVRAVFRTRVLSGVLSRRHPDGPEVYEAEQLAGAIADAHAGASTSRGGARAAAGVVLSHRQLDGELAGLAGRFDASVVVAGAWVD